MNAGIASIRIGANGIVWLLNSSARVSLTEKDTKKENLLTCLCMYRMDTGAGAAHVTMTKSDVDTFNVGAIESTYGSTIEHTQHCAYMGAYITAF